MKRIVVSAFAAVALATSVAACGHHSTPATPAASASVAAEKQQAEAYVGKCLPASNALAQIQLAEKFVSDANERASVAQCLGIPKDQRQNFEADALSAGEHIKWSDKSARSQYFDVTLPNLVVKYQAKK